MNPFDEIDEEDAKPPKYYQPKHYGERKRSDNSALIKVGFMIGIGFAAALILLGIVAAVVSR